MCFDRVKIMFIAEFNVFFNMTSPNRVHTFIFPKTGICADLYLHSVLFVSETFFHPQGLMRALVLFFAFVYKLFSVIGSLLIGVHKSTFCFNKRIQFVRKFRVMQTHVVYQYLLNAPFALKTTLFFSMNSKSAPISIMDLY